MTNFSIADLKQGILPNWIRYFLYAFCLFMFALTAYLSAQHLELKSRNQEEKKTELVALTENAATYLDVILLQVMKNAEDLAERLSTESYDEKKHIALLKDLVRKNDYIYGGSITFRPFGVSRKKELYAPYYYKDRIKKKISYANIASEDSAYLSAEWYAQPMKEKQNRWSKPYRDPAGKTTMITYSALFFEKTSESDEQKPLGVVTIDISTERIRQIAEKELNIGSSGFPALTTQDGYYLYHPQYHYVREIKSLKDVALLKGDNNRYVLAEEAQQKRAGVINHVSTTTKEESWLVYAPLNNAGWSLQNTYIKSDLKMDLNSQRKQLINIMLSGMVFLICLLAIVLRIYRCSRVRLWWFSGITALLIAAGIWSVWFLALSFYSYHLNGIKPMDNEQSLAEYKQNVINEREQNQLVNPIFIPTGLYIDALEFRGANDILISGQLWQKYSEDLLNKGKDSSQSSIAEGVQFVHAKQSGFTEIERVKQDGYLIIRWRFETELRIQLDYTRFPLQRERVGLRIKPREMEQPVALVPDLGAYKLLTSTLKPGLDEKSFLPGWRIDNSGFGFRSVTENANYGIDKNILDKEFDELYFEISMTRIFVDAFISNLTPLVVVLIVLFALTLLAHRIEVGRVISICVAVFFVVVFSHLDIRKHIATGEIFYLEYFFFIVYLTIILVPINALRVAMEKPMAIFDYRDGIIHKAIYWPSIMLMFFSITLYKFY